MTIKQLLDAIWNDPQVRCPGHRVWWLDDEELGYHKRPPRGLTKVGEDLWCARGEKVNGSKMPGEKLAQKI